MRFMELELIPSELRNKVYIFNTYFMDKLCPYDKVSPIALSDPIKLGELFLKCYDNIKKWVKEDLFSKDYLLFPLNLPEHWSLIVGGGIRT
jgi:sentrin-specific protease 7